ELRSPLLGLYNLENLLACVAAADALGLDRQAIVRGLETAGPVPGRLERVRAEASPFPALVDYAHTPDALEAALRSVRELSERHLLVVFGCGGERDREKRPLMGKIAGRLADHAVLTSDNPRREDPAAILAQVEAGLRAADGASYEVEIDRRAAIRRAVQIAGQSEDGDRGGWVLVVAGKGHETTQDLGHAVIPFDDRLVLAELLDEQLGEQLDDPSDGQPTAVPGEARHG
ncbi:MAG: hypothetical protein MI919_12635, partial [Holophagales bacterium]|nr:hypothetical protein [Holophagales bacterium]